MYATKDNLDKEIILTQHARERSVQYGLNPDDIPSMLMSSKKRPKDARRVFNKINKHGSFTEEYVLDDVTFVVLPKNSINLVITVHKNAALV